MQPLPTIEPARAAIRGVAERFSVHRIYCVGRNYADHAKEMGASGREPPFFFLKPADAIFNVAEDQTADWPYPSLTQDLHHELELVVAIGQRGRDISVDDARRFIWGYAMGLDMTRRDLQRAMGDEKKPWEIGKSFDRSAPIGPLHTIQQLGGHFTKEIISLSVNGQTKQRATLAHMIWSVAEQITKLSEANELFPGDIIYSGTPENVGPVVRGDVIVCRLERLPDLSIRIV